MAAGVLRKLAVVVSVVVLLGAAAPVSGESEPTEVGVQSWSSYQRLSFSPGSSYDPSVAVSGTDVHVVWEDRTFENPAILYKRSSDGGVTWSPFEQVSSTDSSSSDPSVAVSGTDVHVVWQGGDSEVFYARSSDGGVTWSPDRQLSFSSGFSNGPSLAVSGTDVHVTWSDKSFGNWEVVYKHSGDGGLTWFPYQRLTSNTGGSLRPSVAVSGTDVHVVWCDFSFGSTEIVYERSSDSGVTWSPYQRLSFSPSWSSDPSVAVSGTDVHVAWYDYSFGNNEIVYKHSADGGVTWSEYQRLSFSSSGSVFPSVAVSGTDVHVAWGDYSFGYSEILYKHSGDGGVTWSPYQRLSWNGGESNGPSVAVSGTDVHVTWMDDSFGNFEIVYKHTTG